MENISRLVDLASNIEGIKKVKFITNKIRGKLYLSLKKEENEKNSYVMIFSLDNKDSNIEYIKKVAEKLNNGIDKVFDEVINDMKKEIKEIINQ